MVSVSVRRKFTLTGLWGAVVCECWKDSRLAWFTQRQVRLLHYNNSDFSCICLTTSLYHNVCCCPNLMMFDDWRECAVSVLQETFLVQYNCIDNRLWRGYHFKMQLCTCFPCTWFFLVSVLSPTGPSPFGHVVVSVSVRRKFTLTGLWRAVVRECWKDSRLAWFTQR